MRFQANTRIATLILLSLSAFLMALYPPGKQLNLLGLFAYAPLILVLEWKLVQSGLSLKRKALLGWLYIMPVAMVFGALGTDWMGASIHAFGHWPLFPAYLLAGIGYGLEVGLLLFAGFALPLIFIRQVNGWDLAFRAFWMMLVDYYYPRLIPWSLGGSVLSEALWLQQGADLIGAYGLGLLVIGINLIFVRMIARYCFKSAVDEQALVWQIGVCLVLFVSFAGYGFWRQPSPPASVKHIDLVSVQPNFSLQALASNPELTFSKRQFNLSALLNDSAAGLARLPPDSPHPRLVIWPETAFPWRFFEDSKRSAEVALFARQHNTGVMLATTEQRGDQRFGLALLINNQGDLVGRYEKITLMPFGEYIPGTQLMPWLKPIINRLWPVISEFERGQTHTVFELVEGYPIAATICFDVTVPDIPRGMVDSGAQFIVNLANLAWFGHSRASDQLEMSARWRAIENRTPVMMSSLNGRTQLFTSEGKNQGQRLDLFTADVWIGTVGLQSGKSFYRHYPHLTPYFLFLLLAAALVGAQRYGRVFSPTS